MTVLLRENLNKATIWKDGLETGVFTVPYDIVYREARGDYINDLPSLPPHTLFYQAAMTAAKKFVGQMDSRNRQLVTHESELEIWGPYQHKEWIAAGNGQFKGVATPRDSIDEILRSGYVDFKIRGRFVSKYGFVPKRWCPSCKNEVPFHTVNCPYCGAPINRDLKLAAELALAQFDPHKP